MHDEPQIFGVAGVAVGISMLHKAGPGHGVRSGVTVGSPGGVGVLVGSGVGVFVGGGAFVGGMGVLVGIGVFVGPGGIVGPLPGPQGGNSGSPQGGSPSPPITPAYTVLRLGLLKVR